MAGSTSTVKVTVGLVPHFEDLLGTAVARRRAVEAAVEAGVSHLGVVDHVSFGGGWGMDGLLQASALLALDHSLPIAVGAYLLALRPPLVVARQISDLTAAAPGRLSVAVGIGGEDRAEITNSGVDVSTRGRRTDESLDALRALLSGEPVSRSGRFIQLHDAVVTPAPDPPVPITVAGRSAAALRRAGLFGDGWLGLWASPRRYAEAVSEVEEHGRAAGRSDVTWNHGLTVWCGFGDTEAEGRSHLAPALQRTYRMDPATVQRWCPCGTPADVAAELRDHVAAGCSTFNVIARSGSGDASAVAVGELRRLLAG